MGTHLERSLVELEFYFDNFHVPDLKVVSISSNLGPSTVLGTQLKFRNYFLNEDPPCFL